MLRSRGKALRGGDDRDFLLTTVEYLVCYQCVARRSTVDAPSLGGGDNNSASGPRIWANCGSPQFGGRRQPIAGGPSLEFRDILQLGGTMNGKPKQ